MQFANYVMVYVQIKNLQQVHQSKWSLTAICTQIVDGIAIFQGLPRTLEKCYFTTCRFLFRFMKSNVIASLISVVQGKIGQYS